jgi:hypothetical protein
MSDALPIPAEVIAAVEARWTLMANAAADPDLAHEYDRSVFIEAAIRVACKEMRLVREERPRFDFSTEVGTQYRYISDWRPVEVESDE